MSADLAVRNARIIDGTGADAYHADVLVSGDRITAVGAAVGDARREIDAGGRVLAPGFVDVHTHDDGALLRHPGMEFKVAQGCTSVVIGNCGFSAVPAVPGEREASGLIGVAATWTDLDGFRAAVEGAGAAVNAMALVGHNTVRRHVFGNEQRAPTAGELAEMEGHVRAAMEQGACGFSTGLVYEPGRYCETDEIVALATVSAEAGGRYATHMRNEADELLAAVDEAIHIGTTAGLPVQISHHKAAGRANWGKVVESLAQVDRANADGADVTLDVYPYEAGSGPMHQYFDVEAIDPELASVIMFASCPDFPDYEGRMAIDVASEQGIAVTELIAGVIRAPQGERVISLQFLMDVADIEDNLRHPLVMIGSDGIPDLRGRPHPRLFGTFPRVLGHYVRDAGVLTLTEAIRRMTSLSCDRFGLLDRGRLGEGQFADLVLFDPATVIDRATYDDPKQEPAGIDVVVVNGRVAYDHGEHTGVGGGRVLHHGR